jgi:REP element-mobilizing transposase RayT
MPAYARKEIVDESVVGVYHCVSRCVRRAFLCGTDHYTGRNFDHRKAWMQDRLEELARIFALDVLGFSMMSNHFHVLLRNRPDVAETWSDEDVARRWYRLHPSRRNEDGTPAEPQPCELAAMQADPDWLALRRRRLASLSSLMAALCEPMARRANREDKATGRFWEGRFRSQAIVDETALLACSIYVDLNPIRACLAETPESSEFTAAYERIIARQQAAACLTGAATGTEGTAAAEPSPTDARDAWLSPVPDGDVPVELQSTPTSGSTRRASDRGFLPMTLDEYLTLLDWTGRAIRSDKRGAIPADLLPILQRLQVNAEVWVETIEHFGRIFRRAAGRVSNLAALAAARGKCWFQGVTASKLAFR